MSRSSEASSPIGSTGSAPNESAPTGPAPDESAPTGPTATALDRVFAPGSIAVVGASAEPAKRGNQILRALAESGYAGRVFPVNPRGGEILGRPVHRSIEDLPEAPDLAVLCTPAEAAPELVRACGRRGVGCAVVLAVGFGESGPEGRALEDELAEAGRRTGVRLVGPNTSGLLNLERGVNLVGARGVRRGGLSLLVQSGNMALAIMTEVTERSWDGISICLGVGNQVDLGFAEGLEYLAGHDGTHAIVVHAEGFRDTGAFLSTAARVCRTKPVVVIKSGRTARGARAAVSHTGSVAGPYERLRAAMARAGIVQVRRTDELLHVAETLGRQPVPSADAGIAILSDGGGQGALATDLLVESGARLAELSSATREALRSLLGRASAVENPVDLAGAADLDPEVFGRAVELLVADPGVGSVLLVGLFGGYGIRFADSLEPPETRAAEAMAEAARSARRGLVVHTMYALHRSRPLAALGERGVPVVASLEVACRCVVELQRRAAWLERDPWPYESPSRPGRHGTATPDPPSRHPALDAARAEGRRALTEPEARAVLTEAGIAFEPAVVADSADALAEALREIGGPVAAKLVSSAITHKSDAGGVVLGVETASQARAAYARIERSAREHAARHELAIAEPVRVIVSAMLRPPRAELLVGAYRDPDLGPVLTVGAGGVWVEALEDVAIRALPVDDRDLREMLGELRVGRVLRADRGLGSVDPAPVLRTLRAVADAIVRWPDVGEVEVNPLFVYEAKAVPVDARIVLMERMALSDARIGRTDTP